jgi:ERCC4-related helicase
VKFGKIFNNNFKKDNQIINYTAGVGKSLILILLILSLVEKNKKCIIFTTKSLINNICNEFKNPILIKVNQKIKSVEEIFENFYNNLVLIISIGCIKKLFKNNLLKKLSNIIYFFDEYPVYINNLIYYKNYFNSHLFGFSSTIFGNNML